jgi:predicted acyl esterase
MTNKNACIEALTRTEASIGEITAVDIEVLPSGTVFEAGTTLRLVIAGRDFAKYPKPMLYARHEDTVNLGVHRVHTGGRFSSWLQIPLSP